LYVDGAPDGDVPLTATGDISNTDPLTIGAQEAPSNQTSNQFAVRLTKFEIFNAALLPTDIPADLYASFRRQVPSAHAARLAASAEVRQTTAKACRCRTDEPLQKRGVKDFNFVNRTGKLIARLITRCFLSADRQRVSVTDVARGG